MVTIQLSKPICNFAGKPIPVSPTDPRAFTIKDILLHYLGVHVSVDKKQVFENLALGLRIQACTDPDITIENSEYLILQEVTKIPQHGDMIMGQLLKELEAAEATKIEPKKGK